MGIWAICMALAPALALAQGNAPWGVYSVGWGDTLASLAETYGTTAAQLARANEMAPDAPLAVGQQLRVPGPAYRAAVPAHWATHVVCAGETVESIALKYGTSPWQILVANHLKPGFPMIPGTKMIIPIPPYRPALALPATQPKPGQQPFRYAANTQLLGQSHSAILQGIRGIGFDWLRQEVRWGTIETQPGQYDWSELDRLVADASAAGVKVLLQVGGFPSTAVPSPQRNDLRLSEDEMLRYADLLSRMAARYRGQVLAYEIWDPPNVSQVWGGSGVMPAAEYTHLLQLACTAIKGVDSKAIVATAALMPTGSHNAREAIEPADYLDEMYRAGAKAYFDVVGTQSWGYNNPPADDPTRSTADSTSFKGDWHLYFRSFELLYPVMQRYGDGAKQIWLVKFGWPSGTSAIAGREYVGDNSEQEQAIYLVEAYAIGRARPYVGLMAFWNFNYAPQVAADDIRAAYSVMNNNNTARLAMEALASMPK
jgi:LysM repeat protein